MYSHPLAVRFGLLNHSFRFPGNKQKDYEHNMRVYRTGIKSSLVYPHLLMNKSTMKMYAVMKIL